MLRERMKPPKNALVDCLTNLSCNVTSPRWVRRCGPNCFCWWRLGPAHVLSLEVCESYFCICVVDLGLPTPKTSWCTPTHQTSQKKPQKAVGKGTHKVSWIETACLCDLLQHSCSSNTGGSSVNTKECNRTSTDAYSYGNKCFGIYWEFPSTAT